MSRDPLGEGTDRTLYSYCGNQPVSKIDPSGLIEIYPEGAVSEELQQFREEYHWPCATEIQMKDQINWENNPWNSNTLHILRGRPMFPWGSLRSNLGSFPSKTTTVGSGSRSWQSAGINASDATRIQNAASRTGQPIRVVGSRASGTAGPNSDWDYVIGGNSRARHSAAGSLPRGPQGSGAQSTTGHTGQDIYTNAQFMPNRPYVEFQP